MGKTLKIFRVVAQVALFTLLTCSLMAIPPAVLSVVEDGMRHWQLIPMSMLGALSVVGVWFAVTLLFGRVYCSTVCPLGAVMDISARLPRVIGTKRHAYRYKPGHPWFVRVAMISILVMAMLFGSLAVSWTLLPFLQVSPSDTYVDMTALVMHPVDKLFIRLDTVPIASRVAISAAINIVFVVGMGMFKGREMCNTLCPVGAALGTVNMFALYHFDINTDTCSHCRRCEQVCKASCIDSETGTVDSGRCVTCFNCVAVCPDASIRYTTVRHKLSTPMLIRAFGVKEPRPSLTPLNSNMKIDKIDNNETISSTAATHNG